MPELTERALLEGQGAGQTSANVAAAMAAYERGQSAAETSANIQQALVAAQAAQIQAGNSQRADT